MLEKSRPSISSEVVLFVKPEEIPTIWLDISTLIGKVKSAYKKKEDPVALFTMLDRESKKELWKVLKDYSSLVALDHSIRPVLSHLNIPKLPERLLFQSHAPSKVDARKVGMEDYFFSILKIPNLPPFAARALCEFLSTDMIDPMDVPDTISRREGYLTKRGKKIRGWKVRYFVIENDHLSYYDKPDGEVQGSINLVGAKVVRQNKNDPEFSAEEAVDKSFRHDFLLVEPKKKDYVRHILCAESDEDRDLWIAALMEVIDQVTSNPLVPIKVLDTISPKKSFTPVSTSAHIAVNNSQDHDTSGRASATPYSQPHDSLTSPVSKKFGDININPELNPTGSMEDEDSLTKEPKKAKRKGFFSSFRNRNGNSSSQSQIPYLGSPAISENLVEFQATPYSAVEQQPLTSNQMKIADGFVPPSNKTLDEVIFAQQDSLASSDIPSISNRSDSPISGELQLKRVFGVPLQEAISLASKQVYNCIVPAIVYRCIEHLKYRDAIFEEGIFRLSGSTSTIRALKDRFNTEYDVDLVGCKTFYDIHAVAGLLKLYLREIPSLILSPYLAPEFREAVDIEDPVTKILKLKSLVQELPRENRDLLCVLFSLLTEVVSYSELNKMNLRNIGIVFAQTLNISAYVLIHFLTDFDAIFGDDEEETLGEGSGVEKSDVSKQPPEQIDDNGSTVQHYHPRPLQSPSQQQDPEFMTSPPLTR
jgi:RalA-binding protein 1